MFLIKSFPVLLVHMVFLPTIGSFCALVLNEYDVLSSWFILKATKQSVVQRWVETISEAKVHTYMSIYSSSVQFAFI